MDSCCHKPEPQPIAQPEHCHPQKKTDWVFWGSLILVTLGYLGFLFNFPTSTKFQHFAASEYELMNKMWLGLGIGVVFVGILSKIPQEFILSILGKPYTFGGIIRATIAGLLLDMCSHGILLVGMKFYKRGASLGQTMAFLISSPWNSLSLTIILISLIGLKWTLAFIGLSMLIAVISGIIFDWMVIHRLLPGNPNIIPTTEHFPFITKAKEGIKKTKFDFKFFKTLFIDGIKDSKMIVKWLLFGVVLTAIIRTSIPHDFFESLLGPTIKGLLWTLLFAGIIEVCSEGTVPMAFDIIHRAGALGNGFLFMMVGVSTNYSGIMSVKETTKSWKIAFALPIVTIPQIVLLSYFLNHFVL